MTTEECPIAGLGVAAQATHLGQPVADPMPETEGPHDADAEVVNFEHKFWGNYDYKFWARRCRMLAEGHLFASYHVPLPGSAPDVDSRPLVQ